MSGGLRWAALALLLATGCKKSPRAGDAGGAGPAARDAALVQAPPAGDAAPCGGDDFCLSDPAVVHAVLGFPDTSVVAATVDGVPARALAGLRSESIWRVGDGGHFAHATDKQVHQGVLGGGKEPLVGVSVDASGQAWIASPHAIFRGSDVQPIKPLTLPPDPARELEAIWAAAPDDVWATGSGGPGPFLHFDGKIWTVPPVAQGDVYHAIWGRAANDIWAVGESIEHFDGQNWVGSGAGMRSFVLRAVWARAADDAWAVGDGGLIMHFDGKHWSEHASGTTANLWSVSGNAEVVWVAGADGLRIRRR